MHGLKKVVINFSISQLAMTSKKLKLEDWYKDGERPELKHMKNLICLS